LLGLFVPVLIIATASSAAPVVQPTTLKATGLLVEAYYSGSYTHTYKGSPEGSPQNPGTETMTAHYTFSDSVSLFTPDNPNGKYGRLGSGSSQDSLVTVTLSGDQSRVYSPEAHQQNCSATLEARGGRGAAFGVQQPPVYIVVNGTAGVIEVSGEPPEIPPVLRVHVTSGDPAACGNGVLGPYAGNATCNTRITNMTDPKWTAGDRGFDNPPYGFLHAVAKIDQFPTNETHATTYTYSYPVKDVSPPNPGCKGTDTVTADSKLTVNVSWATGPAPPSPYEVRVAKLQAKLTAKENAQKDLKNLLPELTYYCGATALGGTGLTLAGAGPAGTPIAIGGAAAFMAALPVCAPLLQAALTYLRIIHDPPVAQVDRLAKVRRNVVKRSTAPCAHWQGQPPSFCTTLKADLTALITTATNLRNVVSAVYTTVGRESGAVKQHKTASAGVQDRHLAKLNPQATAAARAFIAASARFAALFRGAGLRASMSQAQDAQAISALIDRVARAGASESALRKLAGDELTPRAVDVLALLAGHVASPSTASATTTGSSTTTTTSTASAQPTIETMTFRGNATDPSFVIHGTNLGKLPEPNPSGHPSGLNGCPTVAGDTGYDYGTSLYLAVPNANWAGGRYRPELNETDCIDLVVTKFTSTDIEFHFGQSYQTFYPKFALAPGTRVQVVVNGATYNITVKYGQS
jgi:hypothetical protein